MNTEVIARPVKDAIFLEGAGLVFTDDGEVVGTHEAVGDSHPIAAKLCRLYTLTEPVHPDWFQHRVERTICSVACQLKGTPFATVSRHASFTLPDLLCEVDVADLKQMPQCAIEGSSVLYKCRTKDLTCVPGVDHTGHRPYATFLGKSAKLAAEIDDLPQDLHPRLGREGLVKASGYGWTRDQDARFGRTGVALNTPADAALVSTAPSVFEDGFELADFLLELPTEDGNFEAEAYGYAHPCLDTGHVTNNYLSIATGLKTVEQIAAAISKTLIPNKLAFVKGTLFVFSCRPIGLFCSSVEAGFSNGPVICNGKVYGFISGHNYVDNRNLVILAGHPAFQQLVRNVGLESAAH